MFGNHYNQFCSLNAQAKSDWRPALATYTTGLKDHVHVEVGARVPAAKITMPSIDCYNVGERPSPIVILVGHTVVLSAAWIGLHLGFQNTRFVIEG
jgi:hypothetical protein